MEFIIITGMSGAGKSRTIDTLEDIGFFCVDNMPPMLLPKIVELSSETSEKLSKVAVVCDVRGGRFFSDFSGVLLELDKKGFSYKLLFLNCNDDVLVTRYKESRRKHPLAEIGEASTIKDCVSKERALLNPIMHVADYLVDTTYLSTSQLKQQMINLFLDNKTKGLSVICTSFGYKYGLPLEADLVFDVRFLPNPFYVNELKDKTGVDDDVKSYVQKWPQTSGFYERLISMLDFLMPHYVEEGKSQLVIAIGCTGGKHRSVTITQMVFEHMVSEGFNATMNHRDISKL